MYPHAMAIKKRAPLYAPSSMPPKRYKVPRYAVAFIRQQAAFYGSQGRVVQIGMEFLSRLRDHPISYNETLKRGIIASEELIGVTYRLVPRTIQLIDSYAEIYSTRGNVFQAIAAVMSRKYID